MKTLVTLLLILALQVPSYARPDPPPPAASTCIAGAIGIVVCGVLIYGLYRMCQAIPAPDQDPPAQAPISEIPGIGPPSYMHVLPPLRLRNQMFAARVSFQHRDVGRSESAWQTDYTFVATASQIGGFAMVAYDSNGTPVMTNDVPVVTIDGENWASFDFTTLPQTSTNSAAKVFRLISQ